MPSSDVGTLLAASRAQHAAYRRTAATGPAKGTERAALENALRYRLEAHGADPDHADPAWLLDTVPHGEIVAFYRAQLGGEA